MLAVRSLPGRLLCSGPRASYPLLSSYHNEAVAEYTDTPQYPEIQDVSRHATRIRKKEDWYKKVTKLPTLEQKMMELNMPKYYGYWSCHLIDIKPVLNGAEFCRYATKTHVEDGLPEEYYSDVWKQAQDRVDQVAEKVEQLITFHFKTPLARGGGKSQRSMENHQTSNFLLGLHRVLCLALQEHSHIREAVVDKWPRLESFWILGGLPPDHMIRKTRRNLEATKHLENEPIERSMQGVSSPCVGLRVSEGLPQVISREEGLSKEGNIPPITVDPRAYGFKFSHKHATTVTGVWPSEGKQYGQLFLHARQFETHFKEVFGSDNIREAFLQKALVATFTQAHAHATYLGFGPVTELTYPLVQQSAFSDGKRWTLGLYQLNTCTLHTQRFQHNPYNNILWLSKEENLFEEVNDTGVRGLNLPLLTSLLAMYIKKGVPNEDATPYLPLKYVSNHPAKEEYREAFHEHYRHLASNRPRHIEKPEMYLWEKIYKVDFKTRPFEPPTRFFEKHYKQKDPGQTRLDDYRGQHIPKVLREHKLIKHRPTLNSEDLYTYDNTRYAYKG